MQNILIEGDIDLLNEERVKSENFEKSEKETETFASIKKLKYPQEHISDFPTVIVLDDLNKEN